MYYLIEDRGCNVHHIAQSNRFSEPLKAEAERRNNAKNVPVNGNGDAYFYMVIDNDNNLLRRMSMKRKIKI